MQAAGAVFTGLSGRSWGGVFINSFVNSRWAYYGLIIWGFPLPVAPAPETSPLRS